MQSQVWLGASVIFFLVAAIYWPVFRAGFIWDDNAMLTENAFVKARNGLRYLWFSTEPVDYFPLTYTSLWLEWRLWGMNATGYHVTNLILHAASSVLFWRIFRHLKIPGAFVAAIGFALHPVNVESVAWIAERKNTLCMFFYTLTLLFFLRSENQNNSRRESGVRSQNFCSYWLSLFFFLLALLSKTSVVMLPVVLLLCVWWRNRKITARDFWWVSPFFALSLALGLATVWFQHHRAIAEDVIRETSLWRRIGDAGLAIWFYFYKAIFPVQLSFVYPEWKTSAGSILPALAWLALAFCCAFFWWKRRSWGRHLLFSFGYFILMLLPTLGFLNIYFHRYSLVADHWQYFALPGIIALLVSAGAYFFKSYLRAQPIWMWTAGIFVVALLGFAATKRAMIYKNSETLWRDTLSKNPNSWLALNNLGLLLEREGKIDDAISLFEKSLQLRPDQIEGRNNLGSAFLSRGKIEDAMAQYQSAMKLNPKIATTHYNVANVLDQQGKTNEAIAEYREALRLNPNYADAHNNLGCMLVLEGKRDEGMAHFREALEYKPDNADALNNLGSILVESGKPRDAIPFLTRALQSKPDFADAHYNFGNAMLALGELRDATEYFARALKLNPQMHMAHYKSGEAFFRAGKMSEAFAHYSRALELNPEYAETHYQMAVILSAAKNMESAIAHFKEAIRLKPDWVEPLNNLAWILATNPNDKFRDGNRAVELGERACALTENKNPGILDTLAAGYAEAGQFPNAIKTAEKATVLAAVSNKTLAEEIRIRLELYRMEKPFHQ